MSTIVYGFFHDGEASRKAIRDLGEAAIPGGGISIIGGQSGQRGYPHSLPVSDEKIDAVGTGASIGGLIGGGTGLLAGLGIVPIPGLGPVVAAGWLVSMATCAVAGAATGGIIGALMAEGMSAEHARVYADGIDKGGTLMAVRSGEDVVARTVREILRRNGAVNADEGLAHPVTERGEDGAPFAGSEDESGNGKVRYSDMPRHESLLGR